MSSPFARVTAPAELPQDVLPVPRQILPAAEFAGNANEVPDDGEYFPHA